MNWLKMHAHIIRTEGFGWWFRSELRNIALALGLTKNMRVD